MNATFELKKDAIVITLPLNANPPVSSTGKSRILASATFKDETGLEYDGKKISVSCNVIIPTK